MKKVGLLLVVTAVLGSQVLAGTIAAVDSTSVSELLKTAGYPVSTDNSWSSKWTIVEGVEFASLGISSGLSVPGSPAVNQYSAVGWDISGHYFSLTVSLADGYVFGNDIQLIYGGIARSSTGPTSGSTSVIVNGIETVVATYTINTTSSYTNRVDDVAALLDGADSVEIRFYASGASNPLGTYRIGDYYAGGVYTDMGLYGSVVAVPEPATLMLLGLGSVLFGFRRR